MKRITETVAHEGKEVLCIYSLMNDPAPCTVFGTIIIGNMPIQCFNDIRENGKMSLISLGATETWVEEIDRNGKVLSLKWNQPPGLHEIVLNFETAI